LTRGSSGGKRLTHLVPHADNVVTEFDPVAGLAENFPANPLKLLTGARASRNPARACQRLMLPGPGALALVALECRQTGYQQPGTARGPQAHIHIVELARRRLGTEDMHHALTQAGIKHRIVDRPVAIGRAVRIRIMQE